MKAIIEIQNLSKEFGEKTVLDRIDFQVNEGEIFGYLGPNGAGKTTTMRIILGLLEPTAGKTLVMGEDLRENQKLRRKVGVFLAICLILLALTLYLVRFLSKEKIVTTIP